MQARSEPFSNFTETKLLHTDGINRFPAKAFPNGSGDVRQEVAVSISRHARAADNSIEFVLALFLDLRVLDHGKHKPFQNSSCLPRREKEQR